MGEKLTKEQSEFIETIRPGAVQGWLDYGIIPSLTLAQATLESNWGQSGLARKANNLFGIKGDYQGQSVTMPTFEYRNGQRVEVDARFRAYPDWTASMLDHALLFWNGTRDKRDRYFPVIGEPDYHEAAKFTEAGGYATDPQYAEKLIQLIEAHGWQQADPTEGPPHKWQWQIMAKGYLLGLITQPHRPADQAEKWFVVAVGLNMLDDL